MASPDGAGPTDEHLVRLVVRVLAGFVALTLAGGIAAAAGRLADADAGTDESAADVLVGGRSLSPRGGIGPLPGTSVAPYVRARAGALADQLSPRRRRAAVVSFAGYRTPAEALGDLDGLEPVALLVALPGGRPLQARVDEDVAALVTRQRTEAAEEKRALEQLLPTVTDEDFRRQYEADIARLAALLAAPKVVPPVVYAVVVVGPVDRLRAAAARPEVRLVDVGAGATAPGAGDAVGLRPEETAQAGKPPTRPA